MMSLQRQTLEGLYLVQPPLKLSKVNSIDVAEETDYRSGEGERGRD